MGNKLDKQETASIEEVLVTTIMNLFEKKGILSRAEVMQEILEMKKKAVQGK